MLNQSLTLLEYFLTYSRNLLGIILYAVLLVFATLMYKRNSHNYGITLMISSITSIALDILYMSIQYPYLAYRMEVEQGLPLSIVLLALLAWNFVFLSLNTVSAIFLIVSIYLIYKTHKKDRID